ncbi:hypothetical protein D4R89_13325 [bacterium]|nr:MAG: hypothetical protein D4R89_13325 [bacterium]
MKQIAFYVDAAKRTNCKTRTPVSASATAPGSALMELPSMIPARFYGILRWLMYAVGTKFFPF